MGKTRPKLSRTKLNMRRQKRSAAKRSVTKQPFTSPDILLANPCSRVENEFQKLPKNSTKFDATCGNDEEFKSTMAEEIEVEVENEETDCNITGNRIVDIKYLIERVILITEQHVQKCNMGHITVQSENRTGLHSSFLLKCKMCDRTYTCGNKKSEVINKQAVWATLSTGSTYKLTDEFLAIMNIPSLSRNMFYEIHENLREPLSEYSLRSMEDAGKDERSMAIQENNVDADGIPFITVYLDGGWSKRSYGHNYNAPSGVGVIIGKRSGKIIYMAVRNKFCIICKRAESSNEEPSKHVCFKNWEGSSSAMEADIIVEGFKLSILQHGVRYKYFIADGDSNVYFKIQEHVPYGREVSKIECTNHVLKNYGKRLYNLKGDKSVGLLARKALTAKKIKELQTIAQKAIYDNAHGDIGNLINDLNNGPNHVFGNHQLCKDYFCTNLGKINKSFADVKTCGILRLVQGTLNLVVRKANSLIDNETNNRAELFMSIVAKFNMGKRVNFTQRGSYNMRCDIAAMSYNRGSEWHIGPFNKVTNSSPGKFMDRFITKETARKRILKKGQRPRKQEHQRIANISYGPNAQQPKLCEEEVENECSKFLEQLELDASEERIQEIANATVGQFDNPMYRRERSFRLTASNFGATIKRRDYTPCHSLVKHILAPTNFMSDAMEYGKVNEATAIKRLELLIGKEVKQCGLIIDRIHPFLAASPDGIVEDDLVEVKCLPKLRGTNMSWEEAATKHNICLEVKNNKLQLKRNHNYYYQVQGQLNIARKSKCYFVTYIDEATEIFVEEIAADHQFWYDVMLDKLVRFYIHCILPEMIRGNLKRGEKCIDPPFIKDAQNKRSGKSCD